MTDIGACPACLDGRHQHCQDRRDCRCCQPQIDKDDGR